MGKLKKGWVAFWDRLGDLSLTSWLLTELSTKGSGLAGAGGSLMGVWAYLEGFGFINALIVAVLGSCILVIAVYAWTRLRDPKPDISVGDLAFSKNTNGVRGLSLQKWTNPVALFDRCVVTNRADRLVGLQFSAVLRSRHGKCKLHYRQCWVWTKGWKRFRARVINLRPNIGSRTVSIAFSMEPHDLQKLTGGSKKIDDVPVEGFLATVICRDTKSGSRVLCVVEPPITLISR